MKKCESGVDWSRKGKARPSKSRGEVIRGFETLAYEDMTGCVVLKLEQKVVCNSHIVSLLVVVLYIFFSFFFVIINYFLGNNINFTGLLVNYFFSRIYYLIFLSSEL